MLGILVHGDNHFIVEGPSAPDLETGRKLAWRWEVPQLGAAALEPVAWRIVTKAFREDLEWAIVLTGDHAISPAVQTLLGELNSRGIAILADELLSPWHDTKTKVR